MADNVIVLTNRPAKIKKIYEIKLTDKNTPITNRTCPEFQEYYKTIWENIDHNV